MRKRTRRPMILFRYILRTHIAPFLFGTSVIMALFLLQYIMRWVDQLSSKGLDVATISEFMILNLSWIVVLAIPIGVLFSTLMAFGAMSSAHEITVMKASGMGLFKMMIPVMIVGIMLWGFSFWYTDNVLPDTNLQLSGMMRDITRTKPTFAIESGQFTTNIDGFTILARNVDSTGLMTGVTIYDRSNNDRRTVVSADTGRMAFSPSLTRLIVHLFRGEIHQSTVNDPNEYRVIRFDRHQIAMQADRFFYEESDVSGSSRSDREMNIADMQVMVDRAQSEESKSAFEFDSVFSEHMAYLFTPSSVSTFVPTQREVLDRAAATVSGVRSTLEGQTYRRFSEHEVANKYLVEIYKKYAIPFACVIFVLVGCPLGVITKGGNFGISAMRSLGFYILYWVTLIGGEKLADRNILSPGIAMWSGNIIIGVVGIIVAFKVNYETTPLKGLLLWIRTRLQRQ
ncbi:MAG: LptF/LptG family permease [Candidatus Kapabacteria bacterium]|nr:LptF/LptG family permease [Candidatus Kapabacteria bacterium]